LNKPGDERKKKRATMDYEYEHQGIFVRYFTTIPIPCSIFLQYSYLLGGVQSMPIASDTAVSLR
jgi:hypothetical protein